MNKLLKLIIARPSDKTIRIVKVVFGLTLSLILAYNLLYIKEEIQNTIFGYNIEAYKEYIKYGLVALGLGPVLLGLTGASLLKARNMRISQGVFALLLFYISGYVLVDKAGLDYTTLISLLALVPLFAGITGKFISTKGKRHGEKVTKVRV